MLNMIMIGVVIEETFRDKQTQGQNLILHMLFIHALLNGENSPFT